MKLKSWITINNLMKSKLLENITPGEILEEDFLKPIGLSQYRLAKDIGVPARRIPPCAWVASLKCLRSSGSTCNRTTI